MKNNQPYIMFFFLTLCLYSCAVKHDTLEIGKGNDVTVTLNILNKKDIQKIDFVSNLDTTSVSKTDFQNWDAITYGFEEKGEGTVWVIVYSTQDTIKSELYVEDGYHEILTCDARKIKYESSTGY